MTREHQRCSRYLTTAPSKISHALLGSSAVYSPDRNFDTIHVRLELNVDFRHKTVTGTCITTLRAIADTAREVTLRADGMRIAGVRSAGRSLAFRHKNGRLTFRLPRALAAGVETRVSMRYKVVNPTTGFHFVSPGPENRNNPVQLWSQGQPEDAHFWFPCHDAPHEKATCEVLATVPKGFVAVSNGILSARTRSAGTETFHWKMNHPHALYLVSLAVGKFAEIHERWEDVDVFYYCEKGREADARRGFSATIPSMGFFSEYFGVRYPYEKYAQVAAAEFPGGMENTTCTTQTDACLLGKQASLDTDLDLLVSHELAHHWFGNLVTCRAWSHAWLNEGFATYCEMLYTEHLKNKDEADYELETNRHSYFNEDKKRYRRPLVSNRYKYPWVLFDRHLYEKGGWVLHMLRNVLGEERWRKSIRAYLMRYRGESVETTDLISSIETTTGLNLRYFFDQWVYKSGYPHYHVRYQWDKKKKTAEIRIRQTQSVNEHSPLFRMPVALRFTGPGWEKNFERNVDKKSHSFTFKLPGEPMMAEFDPENWILKKLDFNKPFAMWDAQLKRGRSAISRIRAARMLARWGDEAAIRALTAAAAKDSFWGTSAESARALGTIRSAAAFQALKKLLSVPHPKIRRAVVGALGNFPSPETARLLIPISTRDKSLHVQAEALRSLGRQRDPKLLGRLRKALSRKSYWDILASGAVQALAATRDIKALASLKKAAAAPTPYPLRAHALRALGSFGTRSPQALEWVADALASQDERILMAAMHTLGASGDSRTVETLKKMRDSHTDTRIKSYADEAIAHLTE